MASPATPPASPPSRPSSPSPSRNSFRTLARMGTMLRRNSSGFGFGRQTLSRSESKSSLRKEVSSDEGHTVPSPVAESPVREALAAAADAAPGPSPLSHEAKATPDASPAPPPPAVFVAEPESISEPSPQVSAAPKEAISQPVSVPAPVVAPAPAPPTIPAPAPQPPVSVPSAPAPVPAPAPTSASQPPPAPQTVIPPSAAPIVSPEPPRAAAPAPPPAVQERAPDYFTWGDIPEGATKKASSSTLANEESVRPPVPTFVPAALPASEPVPQVQELSLSPEPAHVDPYASSAADSFAWKDDSMSPSANALGKQRSRDQFVASPEQSVRALSKPPSREQVIGSPRSASITLSPKASKSSLASSYGQVVNVGSGRRRVSVSVDPEEQKRGRSRSRASIRISFDDSYSDPFVDPPVSNQLAVPKHALSPIYSVNFPDVDESSVPQTEEPESIAYPEPEPAPAPAPAIAEPVPSTREETPAPISMPLPALNEVTTSRVIREAPSAYSLGASTVGVVDHAPYETNERLPLLPRMPIPDIGTSKAPVDPPAFNDIDVNGNQSRGIVWPSMERSFRSLGWTEHILPDNSVYYSHRELRVATEIDLRNLKKLDAVMDYLDKKRPSEPTLPPVGWELWLRDASKRQYDFIPVKSWINHKDRLLTLEAPPSSAVESSAALSEDDRLDMEYRYWTYIESHPAHEPSAASAHAEAMDALTWCYTDCLLPSERTIPPAFSPQECQELMGLLRTDSNGTPGNALVRTRIVARVLLRQAQWRQHYFRPAKPLPSDPTKISPPVDRRIPFRRAFMDVIMSILCLGIPYLYMDRANHHRSDEEGGLRGQGALLVIGGCACLVAAVILSASVTLLTLPGIDDISRLAGMFAILFSASSMVSSVVALFKYKADLERTVVYVGGEGLMILSRRSIVMSLPVVFLAWAMAAFITGITLYSFRGITLTSKVLVRQPFVDYTHWAVVGGLGALAGILLVSIFMARK